MSAWVALATVGGGTLLVRRWLRAGQSAPAQVQDITKAGDLFALAAGWLRSGDVNAARRALDLIGAEGWRFAYNEVVLPSPVPRVTAMAGRMSPSALLSVPPGVSPGLDRLAQVETLVAIANEIKGRTWRY